MYGVKRNLLPKAIELIQEELHTVHNIEEKWSNGINHKFVILSRVGVLSYNEDTKKWITLDSFKQLIKPFMT